MKKKLLIIGGVVFGVLAILVILLFTLFALKTVKVDFRTSHSADFPSQEEIVESGQFSYGMPVLFLGKNKFKERIEQSNPYIEVINIETKFPNTFVVHVRQRQEIFAFECNGKTYFCDNNLVILREEESQFSSTQSNSILLTGLALPEQQFLVGDRLEIKNYVDIYSALLSNNIELFEQKSIIESIDFSIFTDSNTDQSAPMAEIHTFAGNDFFIYNADKYLDFKMAKFMSAYSGLYDLVGKQVSSSDTRLWTEEMLTQAFVKIDNYYRVTDEKNPVYANIFPKNA